jgi:tetratricopeptide (TPR) repeat protein
MVRSVRSVASGAALAASFSVISAAQPTPAPAAWTALTAKLSRAADNGHLADLKASRADVQKAVTTPIAGVAPAVVLYTVAYADYRLAADDRTPAAERPGLADDAEQNLRESIRKDAAFADAYGLLSAVLSLKIAWAASAEAKSSIGPESAQSLGRGLALASSNPRLLIIQGSSMFRRPPEYGGDPTQAEALFRRAADSLDAAKDAPWPNWGRVDAHAWLGQALAKRGDKAGALAEYNKALAIAPDSVWVKTVLLPAIK